MENRLITQRLYIPVEANPRFSDLTRKECDKGRIIGGDQADLRFWGYTVERGRTMLTNPELIRGNFDGWTDDDVNNVASDILAAAYASIGAESIEHS